MLAFTFATLLLSCNVSTETIDPNTTSTQKSELQTLYENTFNGKSVFINGDTTIKYKEIQLHSTPATTNISNLLNANGTFKMVAIGGGLTAGARDGGLHRNAQLTSFPNLIAIQMKADFKQPLFAESEANGYGYKVLSSMSNGVPKYKAVSNNLAILKTSPTVELNPYNGEIDNWGVPFSAGYDWRFDKELTTVANWSLPYKSRVLLNTNSYGKNNTEYNILSKKYDFILIESGFDHYPISVLNKGISSVKENSIITPYPYENIIAYSIKMGAKVVISNIPDFTDLPCFNIIKLSDIRRINQSEIYIKSTTYNSDKMVEAIQDGCILLPDLLADSLMNKNINASKKRGLGLTAPLERNEVYTLDRRNTSLLTLKGMNDRINSEGKKSNFPVVDLYSLFKKIVANNYITNDGIKVNSSNFFSSDGIFPSAFGQAVIANEYIKTINEFYKTNIPLIQTAYYLNK